VTYRLTATLGDKTFEEFGRLAWLDRRSPKDHARWVLEQYVARSRDRLETSPGLVETPAEAEREPAGTT
jgi:hypothetical protein